MRSFCSTALWNHYVLLGRATASNSKFSKPVTNLLIKMCVMLLSLRVLIAGFILRPKSLGRTCNIYIILLIFARSDFDLETNPPSKRRLGNITHNIYMCVYNTIMSLTTFVHEHHKLNPNRCLSVVAGCQAPGGSITLRETFLRMFDNCLPKPLYEHLGWITNTRTKSHTCSQHPQNYIFALNQNSFLFVTLCMSCPGRRPWKICVHSEIPWNTSNAKCGQAVHLPGDSVSFTRK